MKTTGIEHVVALVKDHPIASVANVADGKPWVRVMVTARATDSLELFFATYAWSNKVGQLESDPSVCLTYLDHRGRDARVFGTAEFLHDQQIKDELWDDSWAQYYPGGKVDEGYIVMKVTPDKVEYREHEVDGMQYRRVL